MEAKEILTRVKQLFNDLVTPAAAAGAPPADAPKEYDLKDGGKVTIDKLEAGGIVMIDGAPALPGDVELADGTKLTIGDNGVISTLTPASGAPADPAMPPAFDAQTKFTEFETTTAAKFASYEQKFATYEQKFAEYETKLGKQAEMIEKLLQFGQLMVDAPAAAADPSAKINNSFKEVDEVKVNPILFN